MPMIFKSNNIQDLSFGELPSGLIISNHLYNKLSIQPIPNGFFEGYAHSATSTEIHTINYNITSFIQDSFGGQLIYEYPLIMDSKKNEIFYSLAKIGSKRYFVIINSAQKTIVDIKETTLNNPFIYLYNTENEIVYYGLNGVYSLNLNTLQSTLIMNPVTNFTWNIMENIAETDRYNKKLYLFAIDRGTYSYYMKDIHHTLTFIGQNDNIFYHYTFNCLKRLNERYELISYYYNQDSLYQPYTPSVINYVPSKILNDKMYTLARTSKNIFYINHVLDLLEYNIKDKKYEEYSLSNKYNQLLNIPDTFSNTTTKMTKGSVNIITTEEIKIISKNNITLTDFNLFEEYEINNMFALNGLQKQMTLWTATATTNTSTAANATRAISNGWVSATNVFPQTLSVTSSSRLVYGYVIWVKTEFSHQAPKKWIFRCNNIIQHEMDNAEFIGDIPLVFEFAAPIAATTSFSIEILETWNNDVVRISYIGLIDKPLIKDNNPFLGLTDSLTTAPQNNGYDLKILSKFPNKFLSVIERNKFYEIEPIENTSIIYKDDNVVGDTGTTITNTNNLLVSTSNALSATALTKSANITTSNRAAFIYNITNINDLGIEAKYYKINPQYLASAMPRTWQLLGSNDNSTWVTLHAQSTDANIINQNACNIIREITNPGRYKYYKFEVITVQGTTTVRVGGFCLLDENQQVIAPAEPSLISTYNNRDLCQLTSVANISSSNIVGFIYTINNPSDGLEATHYKFTNLYAATILPRIWKLYGSNDKTNWILLHDQSVGVAMANQSQCTIVREITNPGKYKHYKLEIEATQGNSTFCRIGGFHLLTKYDNDLLPISPSHYTSTRVVGVEQKYDGFGGTFFDPDEINISEASRIMNYWNNTWITTINPTTHKHGLFYVGCLIGDASTIKYADTYSVQFQYNGKYDDGTLIGVPKKIYLYGLRTTYTTNGILNLSNMDANCFELLDTKEIDNINYVFDELIFNIKNPKTVKGYLLVVDGDSRYAACYLSKIKFFVKKKRLVNVFKTKNVGSCKLLTNNINNYNIEHMYCNDICIDRSSENLLESYILSEHLNDNYLIITDSTRYKLKIKSYRISKSLFGIDMPKTWKVYKSEDLVDWVEIQTVIYENWKNDYEFIFEDIVETKYLKFVFIDRCDLNEEELPSFKDYIVINNNNNLTNDVTTDAYSHDLYLLDRINKKAILMDRVYNTCNNTFWTTKDIFIGQVKNGFTSYTIDYVNHKISLLNDERYNSSYTLFDSPYRDIQNNIWNVVRNGVNEYGLIMIPTYKTKKCEMRIVNRQLPYLGTDIIGDLFIKVVDQNGYYVNGIVKLTIIGSAVFFDNNLNTLTVSCNNMTEDKLIKFVIKGEDYINIECELIS